MSFEKWTNGGSLTKSCSTLKQHSPLDSPNFIIKLNQHLLTLLTKTDYIRSVKYQYT